MAKTRSITRNHNHDDAFSRKRFRPFDNGSVAPWSELNNDVLFLVLMQLGAFDFFAFSGVCKLWRSLALCNKKRFMETRRPMDIGISSYFNKKDYYIEDFKGRKFKTLHPYSVDRTCIGLTCGYLVFYGKKTDDFWVVNPITRHELHFPGSPIHVCRDPSIMKGILVFSPSMKGWVFVVLHKYYSKLWFCIVGKVEWNHVSSTFPILDLLAFKGKIYTIDTCCHVYEMSLNPEPKLTILEIKNSPTQYLLIPAFVRTDGNLYLTDCFSRKLYTDELDFEEMKWVWPKEKKINEYDFFTTNWKYGSANMWHFPDRCLNVDIINE